MDVFFHLSKDVQHNVMVRIHCVTGLAAINALEQKASFDYSPTTCSDEYELFIEAELYQKGMRLGLPVCCSYKQFTNGTYCEWNEWIRFPVRFCDISYHAQLVFTLYAVSPVLTQYDEKLSQNKEYILQYNEHHADWVRLRPRALGGVTLPLFESRILRYGRHKLRLAPNMSGDGSHDSETLFWKLNPQMTVKDRIESILTMKSMRTIPRVRWLDGLTNRRFLKIANLNPSDNNNSGNSGTGNNTNNNDGTNINDGNNINNNEDVNNFGEPILSGSNTNDMNSIDTAADYGSSNTITNAQSMLDHSIASQGNIKDIYSRHNIKSNDDSSQGIYLYVDLPNLGHPVVFQEKSKGYRAPKLTHRHFEQTRKEMSQYYPNDDSKYDYPNDPNLLDRRRRDNIPTGNIPTNASNLRLLPPHTALNETMLLVIHDPEMMNVNPIAEKNQKLSKHTDDDGDVRPTIEDNARLMKIIASPSRELSEQDKRMLWKFRNHLVHNPKALTKFLRSVKQDDEDSISKAVDLMKKWADIEIADALELLSVHFVDSRIREFAIEVLERANYEDLELYLMQLVQALRFETQQENSALAKFLLDKALKCNSFRLLNFLYWSVWVLKLEEQEENTGDNNNNNNPNSNNNNPNSSNSNANIQPKVSSAAAAAAAAAGGAEGGGQYAEYSESRYTNYLAMIVSQCKSRRPDYYEEIDRQIWLVDQLLVLSEDIGKHRGRASDKKEYLRACIKTGKYSKLQDFERPVLIPVRPTIRVYGLVWDQCSVFKSAMCPLLLAFKVAKQSSSSSNEEGNNTGGDNGNYYDDESNDDSNEEANNTRKHNNNNNKKRSSKKSTIEEFIDDNEDVDDPRISAKVQGLKNEASNKSANLNATTATRKRSSSMYRGSLTGDALAMATNDINENKIKLPLTEWGIYRIIWKNGDDLRQDQLIIQMINLMDILLKRVNLDLCLTPYPVLATGLESGMMEFVEDSSAIASVLKSYNDDIKQFLNENSAKKKNMQQVVDTFVRSCAGYCVITFLLGVGDRHLDNILITKQGHLFHIDYGFIYGDDPKPWPPPMKICKQMIDAMGGYNSNLYKQFQEHMVSCYKQLRKSANLILNLLSLMGGKETVSNRHANNLSKSETNMVQSIEENVTFVHNKFRLDLNEEEAAIYLQNIAEQSVNALFTKIVDKVHDWVTYWR